MIEVEKETREMAGRILSEDRNNVAYKRGNWKLLSFVKWNSMSIKIRLSSYLNTDYVRFENDRNELSTIDFSSIFFSFFF